MISLANEADLQLETAQTASHDDLGADGLQDFVTRTIDRSYEAARRFSASAPSVTGSISSYPNSVLARKLELAARLIKLDGGTRIYYVSQPGYDTHSTQAGQHRRLLGEYSSALAPSSTISRTPDWGSEWPCWPSASLAVESKRMGLRGPITEPPGRCFSPVGLSRAASSATTRLWTELDAGDLKMSIDFRRVYATLLDRWLSIPAHDVLDGSFDPLPLVSS